MIGHRGCGLRDSNGSRTLPERLTLTAGTEDCQWSEQQRGNVVRHRFAMVWWSTVVSNLGDGVRLTALPLLAFSLTQDPVQIAALTAVESLPWLLLAVPIGSWVDRWDRRRAIVVANLVRAVLVGGIAALVLTNTVALWHLYVFAVLLPTLEVVADTGSQGLLPVLVKDEELETANSRLFAGRTVAEDVLGAPIAGILFGSAAALPFALDGASFLVAGLLLAWLPGRYRPQVEPDEDHASKGKTYLREIREGFRAIYRLPLLRELTVLSAALDLALMSGTALLVIYAKENLGLSDFQFGLLFTAAALGSVSGGIVAPRVVRRFRLGPGLLGAIFLLGCARLLFALAWSEWVAFVGFFLAGVAVMIWFVASNAYQQRITPNALLGRVFAISQTLSHLGAILGALLGAAVATVFDARATMTLGSVIILVVGVAATRLLRSPTARARKIDEDEETSDAAISASSLAPDSQTSRPHTIQE